MNKKTLWIIGLILVAAVVAAAYYADVIPSAALINGVKNKSSSSEGPAPAPTPASSSVGSSSVACDEHRDCGPTQSCQGGYCVEDTNTCDDDPDCPSGYSCISSHCMVDDGVCENDSDCGGRAKCRDGSCYEGCVGNLDCSAGLTCNSTTGVCLNPNGCLDDSDCVAPQTCKPSTVPSEPGETTCQ